MENEENKTNTSKSIPASIKDNREDIDTLSKEILGYGKAIETILDPDIPSVNFGNTSINRNQVINNNLFNISGKDRYSKYKINEKLYSIFDNPNISHLDFYSELQGRNILNLEMNYIVNEMSELQNALEMLANDVVYPNVASMSGINITFINNDENETEETSSQLMKFFKPLDDPLGTSHARRLYNYNIDEDVKRIVHYFGIYGHQIVATIPYKKIVQDLLYDKSVDAEKFGDTLVEGVSEAVNLIDNKYKDARKPFSEALLSDSISNIVSSEANDEIRNIYDNKPYSEEDVEYIKYMLEKNESTLFTDAKEKPMDLSGDIMSLLSSGEDAVNLLAQAGVDRIKEKRNKKFNIDNIIGCTHDVLDPSTTIPVIIKDELLGVYVVDMIPGTQVQTGRNISNLINASNIYDGTRPLSNGYTDKVRSILFNDIRNVLYKNLDKQMLKNNPNLVEDIEFIIKENANRYGGMNTPRVKFIPSEYLTIHKFGNGVLGTPLLLKSRVYAHLYINLLRSDLMSKMFFDKPRYAVKLPYNGDTSNQSRIMQSINSFRHALPRLSDMGLPDVINTSSANFHTVIVPLSANDKEAFTIEQLPTVESKDNSEYLSYLRNQATMSIGYPADLFNPSQQLDFAKKISNINMNVLIKVIAIQQAISVSLTELCTKRLQYMTGNENLEAKVTFEVPSELVTTINTDILNQKNALSDVYGNLIDNDPAVPKEHKEQVKQQINKKLLANIIDTNLYNSAILDVLTYKEGTRDIEE